MVEHAADRGDPVVQFLGGVQAPYGCYLANGEVYTGLTLGQCRDEAAVQATTDSVG